MTVLIAILLLLFIPAVMVILHLTKLTSKYLWLAAMVGALGGWGLVFAARYSIPAEIAPQTWQPVSLFPFSPALRVDDFSWPMAMALASLLLAVVLTSVARLEQRGPVQQVPQPALENMENPIQASQPSAQGVYWKAWAANLALTSLGLVAVLAGNLLTLLLAWAALDIIEVVILSGQAVTSKERGQVVRSFGARLGGIGVLLMAGIASWAQGELFNFDTPVGLANLFLLAAAGIRLGIIPIMSPSLSELPMRIGLGTIIRLVPTASSLMLLVRSANNGLQVSAGLIFLGFAALAGLVGGIGWLNAKDALGGRPYWILAASSMAMGAAVLHQPWACLAWSLVVVLAGSLLFLSSLKARFMLIIGLFSVISVTGLPFSPAWLGTQVFEFTVSGEGYLVKIIAVVLGLTFFGVHVLMLRGYITLVLRGSALLPTEEQQKIVRWVWWLYVPGLASLPVAHWLLSWMFQPDITGISVVMWAEGAAASAASAIWMIASRAKWTRQIRRSEKRWLASGQIYQPLTQFLAWFFRMMAQMIKVISTLLEGEAGILWAFVLLVLALAFLQQY